MNPPIQVGTLHGIEVAFNPEGGDHGDIPLYEYSRDGEILTACNANLLPHALKDNGKPMKHAITRMCEKLNISFKTGMEILRFCQAHHNLMS